MLKLLNKGSVAVIELSRPNELNALNNQLFIEISTAFKSINQVAVLSQGTSKHFCAGLDLKEGLSVHGDDVGRKSFSMLQLIERWQNSLTDIEDCKFPAIAVVDGACIGAGVDLIACCDIRYCTRDAYFSIMEVNVGMAADLGSLQRLSKYIPQSTLSEWAFTGRKIGSAEALQVGLVSKVFESKSEMNRVALELAEDIASKSPLAVVGTKLSLMKARNQSVQEGLDFAKYWNMSMLQSEDVQKSVVAQLQKTKVKYSKL